jgi:hypothetical protein
MVVCDGPYFSYRLANVELNGIPVLYLDRGLSYHNLMEAARHLPVPAIDFLTAFINGDVNELAKLALPKRPWWKKVLRRA